ncbi:MAG: Cytosol aminopeptidase [Ignavibacteria bacterium]|nr:Cytosol aminopeptidase [Ignavibacteria bacterium]
MKIKFEKTSIKKINSDAYLFLCFEDKKLFQEELNIISNLLKCKISKVSLEDFKGKENQTVLIYSEKQRIILSGLGLSKDLTLEKIRRATARGVKKANSLRIKRIALEILQDQTLDKVEMEDVSRAQTISSILALYNFDKYYTKKQSKETTSIKEIILFSQYNSLAKYSKEIESGIKTGAIIGNATNLARDLGNEPSNIIYPESLADFVVEKSSKSKYSVEILDKKQLTEIGMNGVLEVAKGSKREARFIILKYSGGAENEKPYVLVGKGVTFDSGGISIKPAAGMALMKVDMGGGAAVVGVFEAVSKLGLNLNVIGLIPCVENMPGGNSFKPGDVIKAYNGMTIEVDNTDAEGRLILADALSYASNYNPEVVIDMATLTGASIIAIGNVASIIMGNDQSLINDLIKAGMQTHDRVWQLPLWDDYDKMIDSEIADVRNTGKTRQAGTILGGMFLKRFIGKFPWAHIDIAATAMRDSESDYDPKNATGSGVRLVTQFLKNVDMMRSSAKN